jgi:hypothetical protein
MLIRCKYQVYIAVLQYLDCGLLGCDNCSFLLGTIFILIYRLVEGVCNGENWSFF